nr:class I SAM-dependent methyltransferase [Prauserella isguenensis]
MSRGTSFCSDLGETAFLSFTHPTFEQLISDLAPTSFLDVGCGEGYQVAAAAKAASVERALGVEMDPEVAASANTRLAELPGAEVRAGNVNSVAIDDEFDLVFGCYMLFYMERDDQLAMLRKVKELLAPDGVFVLCQYFPDFTDFQQVMIENAGGAGIQHYIGDVVNSCIDAEVLLNQILEHFRSGIFWHEYKAMLEEVGFEVSEIRPADPLFYSHYVVARRSET